MLSAPLADLGDRGIENVYVFLADAVRYDELPAAVADRGVTFKTVAQAMVTPQVLPTIASGRLPVKHGATWFDHVMNEDLSTFYDLPGYETGYNELVWERSLAPVLGNPGEVDLATVDDPFVVFEHDNGGHAPYPHHDADDPAELLRPMDSREELLTAYRRAVAGSAERFAARLDLLEQRGLLEDTLVIYMADHGELLGERGGFVGHGIPMTPEVVYTPTVFIHPSLPAGERRPHLLKQVDVYPTVVGALTGTTPSADGADLREPVDPDRPTYSQAIMRPPAGYRDTVIDPGYDVRGVWTRDGGHVFAQNSRLVRAVAAGYDATMSGNTAAYNVDRNVLRTLKTTLSQYLRNYHRYGEPGIETEAARDLLANTSTEVEAAEERDLPEETREQLVSLGYH